MPKSAWPTLDDLKQRLSSASIPFGTTADANSDDATLSSHLAKAIADFGNDTEQRPFLNTGGAKLTHRFFDPPGAPYAHAHSWALRGGNLILSLEAGLLGSGHSADDGSYVIVDPTLSVTGLGWTPGVQYWLRPTDAFNKNKPYTHVEFSYSPMGLPECIDIYGAWGYCAILMDDVWDGVLSYAAYLCIPETAARRTGGTIQRQSGVTMERFAAGRGAGGNTGTLPGAGSGAWSFEAELWQQSYSIAVDNNTRRPIGV